MFYYTAIPQSYALWLVFFGNDTLFNWCNMTVKLKKFDLTLNIKLTHCKCMLGLGIYRLRCTCITDTADDSLLRVMPFCIKTCIIFIYFLFFVILYPSEWHQICKSDRQTVIIRNKIRLLKYLDSGKLQHELAMSRFGTINYMDNY